MNRLVPFNRADWTPFSRLEDLFRPFFAEPAAPSMLRPKLDVVETPESYDVTVEVPGVDPADVHITLAGETLTVRGEKKEEKREEGEHRHLVERHYGAFERTLTFPGPVAADGVEAASDHGVITVRVMKSQKAQPRKIEVKTR